MFLGYVVNFHMSLIEEFTESEKQKLNWLRKLSANYPDVTETRLLAGGYATICGPPGIVNAIGFQNIEIFLEVRLNGITNQFIQST